MALSLFCTNKCQFDNCGLYFASLYDLIQHVEETHLPAIESKQRKIEEERAASLTPSALSSDAANKATATPPVGPALPLSAIYRLFPVLPPHKAQPIKYEPTKISFYHYRKKQIALPTAGVVHYSQTGFVDKSRTTSRSEHDEEVSNDSFRTAEEDGEAYEPNDEKRHKCPVEGCNKRYKNSQGARYHVRTVHGLNEDGPTPIPLESVVINSDGQAVVQHTQPALNRTTTVRQYHKCSHCSKKYKTMSNLNKHMQEAHQRVIQNHNFHTVVSSLSPESPAAITNPVSSQQYQNDSIQEPVMVSTQQVSIGVNSNQNTIGPSTNIHFNAMPTQALSPNTTSYQYQQQTSYSPISTTVPVRTISVDALRPNTNPNQIVAYGTTVEGSQSTDGSIHIIQQGQQQQRLPPISSANNQARSQYASTNLD